MHGCGHLAVESSVRHIGGRKNRAVGLGSDGSFEYLDDVQDLVGRAFREVEMQDLLPFVLVELYPLDALTSGREPI